jgi:hypothetical protein
MKPHITYDSTIIYGGSGRIKKSPRQFNSFHGAQKIVRVNNLFFQQKNSRPEAVIGVNTTYIPYTIFCEKGEVISAIV